MAETNGDLQGALDLELGNVCIISYSGVKIVYDLDEGRMISDPDFEWQIPPVVRLNGILRALRAILEVPELESVLAHTVKIMRRYKKLPYIDTLTQEDLNRG